MTTDAVRDTLARIDLRLEEQVAPLRELADRAAAVQAAVASGGLREKDLAPLLELLVELSLSHRWPLPQTTRQCLGSLKTSGKGRAAQQRLLQGT